MFKLMLITNDQELAQYAVNAGVERIFVDLEINGKFERQGHLDTLISKHTLNDVQLIRKAVPDAELVVRINPLYKGTAEEVEKVLAFGADLIMLPMFHNANEVAQVCRLINKRAKCIPLVETAAAAESIAEVVALEGVDEIYIGLNDLHRDLGASFMFEPLANGLVDQMVEVITKAGLPFGFGGIARLGEGVLPAELILAEHSRLKSSSVILSRTFHRRSESVSDLEGLMSLEEEVKKLIDSKKNLDTRLTSEMLEDSTALQNIVAAIIKGDRR